MDRLFGYIISVVLATGMCFGGILGIMLFHYITDFGINLGEVSWFEIYLTSQIFGFFIGSLVYIKHIK